MVFEEPRRMLPWAVLAMLAGFCVGCGGGGSTTTPAALSFSPASGSGERVSMETGVGSGDTYTIPVRVRDIHRVPDVHLLVSEQALVGTVKKVVVGGDFSITFDPDVVYAVSADVVPGAFLTTRCPQGGLAFERVYTDGLMNVRLWCRPVSPGQTDVSYFYDEFGCDTSGLSPLAACLVDLSDQDDTLFTITFHKQSYSHAGDFSQTQLFASPLHTADFDFRIPETGEPNVSFNITDYWPNAFGGVLTVN